MSDRLSMTACPVDTHTMAQALNLKVQCHACGYTMEGTAKYGQGHYVPVGVEFDFVATGKIKNAQGKRVVKGEVTVVCPSCTVKNKYLI